MRREFFCFFLKEARLGMRRNSEAAAWIYRDDEGRFRLYVYGAGAHRNVAWRHQFGRPPAWAVAQVHSHPNNVSGAPSTRAERSDWEASARFEHRPIYVVSTKAIWEVTSAPVVEGTNPVQLMGMEWWVGFRASDCEGDLSPRHDPTGRPRVGLDSAHR